MAHQDEPDWAPKVLGPFSPASHHERRSTVWNDDQDLSVPEQTRHETIAEDWGKFFPRGMRGHIERIQVFSRGNAAAKIKVRIAPAMSMGYTYQLEITPGVPLTWYSAVLRRFWNFDSLMVWVNDCEAGTFWVYDDHQPYDGHSSPDGSLTWQSRDIRPFIRIIYTGETAGDVPVSGTINNVPVPSTSSDFKQGIHALTQNVGYEFASIMGAGYCDLIVLDVDASVSSHTTHLYIITDGRTCFNFDMVTLSGLGCGVTTQPLLLTNYAENARCTLILTKRFEFKHWLRAWSVNHENAQNIEWWVHPTLIS